MTQLKNIWSKDFPRNRLKKFIIDTTQKEDITHFEFIKKTEPTFYIQALIVRNQTIDKKLLLSISKKMKKERNGFLFYYLGLAKRLGFVDRQYKDDENRTTRLKPQAITKASSGAQHNRKPMLYNDYCRKTATLIS